MAYRRGLQDHQVHDGNGKFLRSIRSVDLPGFSCQDSVEKTLFLSW